MCFKVATLKNYSKLLVAYYVGLIISWGRNLGKAQLSSLSLILEASDGEAGTGRSISRMASSLACLVAPCILSLSLSPWVSYSPGPPECLMAWQPGAVMLLAWCLSTPSVSISRVPEALHLCPASHML